MPIDVAEVKRRLFTLLNDENMVNEYIRAFGPVINMKNIKEIKERKLLGLQLEQSGPGDDPVYEITVTCPVCNQNDIVCYELRAKSQQISLNKFLVPLYTGAAGYKSVDYTLIYTTVCPRCLCASPDKNDFIRGGKGAHSTPAKSQLSSNVLMMLQEKIGERKAFLKTVTDYANYFKRPRSFESAIASLRLAMMRASVEAWFELPYSLYKLGSYAIRIAKIIKDSGGNNKEVLHEALGYIEEAFKTSNCPSEDIEMQVIYIIVALYLHEGDFKTANSYLNVFASLKNTRLAEMKANPKLNTAAIDRWHEKAKFLWEDRDRADLFQNES